MRKIIITMILVTLCAASAWCDDWDARTKRTNTSIQDSDIKAGLSQGINKQFVNTFPSKKYGIYVLVDRSVNVDRGNDVVYVLMGLCKRHTDGTYKLPEATYSTMLVTNSGNERQLVQQRLAAQAAEFAKLMVDNASKVR
jgi:hypothetical protein